MNIFKEFKPALFFLLKFLGIYFGLNLLYGLFVESYGNGADPITVWVADQSVWFLQLLGEPVKASLNDSLPTVLIQKGTRSCLSVYEGCNGINIMVLFTAFIIAFKGSYKKVLWFIPLGLFLIHAANIFRIVMLYYIAEYHPDLMYFTHKYLFTAIIYIAIFILWYFWVTKVNAKPKGQYA